MESNACWFCGYDLSGTEDTNCPECGRDPSKAPPPHRVRHGGAVLFSIFGFLVIVGIAFVLLLDLASTGSLLPIRQNSMRKVFIVCAIAGVQAIYGLRLMFRPPVGIDERSTAPLAFWIAGFLCLAAVMVAIM